MPSTTIAVLLDYGISASRRDSLPEAGSHATCLPWIRPILYAAFFDAHGQLGLVSVRPRVAGWARTWLARPSFSAFH